MLKTIAARGPRNMKMSGDTQPYYSSGFQSVHLASTGRNRSSLILPLLGMLQERRRPRVAVKR